MGILDKKIDEVTYTIFDFETTGLSYGNGDKVVEVAMVKYSLKDGIIDQFSSLINPNKSIPNSTSAIHGIYDEDVKNAPYFQNIIPKILSFIDSTILVGHNVYFDHSFLLGELSEYDIKLSTPYLCTMYLPGFYGGKTRQKLTAACDEHGIELKNAHSALYDTIATTKLLEKQIEVLLSNRIVCFNDLIQGGKAYKFTKSWRLDTQAFEIKIEGLKYVKLLDRSQNNAESEKLPSSNSSIKKMITDEKGKGNKEGCYIATAVYGDRDSKEVKTLRRYRDQILLNSFFGRMFVRVYYKLSPSIAARIKCDSRISKSIKHLLNYILKTNFILKYDFEK